MLKIKDNIDLEELSQKYELYRKGFDYKTKEIKNYNDYDLEINAKTREISYADYCDMVDWDKFVDKLYDLIKADLVEKVE